MEVARVLEDRFGGRGQIGRAADQLRHLFGKGVHHHLAGVARRHRLAAGGEARQALLPAFLQLARVDPLELLGQLRMLFLVRGEEVVPGRLVLRPTVEDRVPVLLRLLRHVEEFVVRPAQVLLGLLHVLDAQRLAVDFVGARLRGAVADDRPHRDDRRLVLHRLGVFNGFGNRIQVVAVGHLLHMPVVGLETLLHILGEGKVRGAVQRYEVVVVEEDQLAEREGAGQRGGLVRDPFHQVAVPADAVGVVVDHVVAGPVVHGGQVLLGDRHAHRLGETLPQRPGRDLDPVGVAVLRMPGGPRMPLPELLEVRDRDVVAAQVQRAVEQRRRMAVRQHEAVAVGPLGVLRVVAHVLVKQEVRDRRVAQRRARMPAVCLLHRVHCEKSQRIDRQLVQFAHKPSSFLSKVRFRSRIANCMLKAGLA